MTQAHPFAEIWRGDILESVHAGHAVLCDDTGQIVEAWGDPTRVILPRSSAKMLQALPLIESGAADAHNLTTEQLALACASHNGAAIHTTRVAQWLSDLALGEPDLRCGTHDPMGKEDNYALLRAHEAPCQLHNNCSGKHAGFLTLNKHIGGGAEYVDPSHPIQIAIKQAFEEVTGEDSPGFGIDGCSAPNFATTLHGMGRAMAAFASADDSTTRGRAMTRLWQAMIAHPALVAGEPRACTQLMRATSEPVALKTGAEGFFIAILPQRKMGIALKAACGTTRAAECAIAALLVKLGALDPNHPATKTFMTPEIKNANGWTTGYMRPAPELLA